MEHCSTSGVGNKYISACCCCLQDDCSMDISSDYFYCGTREVYETMLKDTLNIQIAGNAPYRWRICEPCVSRLRDASDFRQMVLTSQEVFREHLANLMDSKENSSNMESDISITEIKVERLTTPSDIDCEDGGGCGVEDFDDDGISVPSKHNLSRMLESDDNALKILANLKTEAVNAGRPPADSGAPRTRRERRTRLKTCKMKYEDIETLPTDSASKNWSRILERRGNGPILRENSLKLLANSSLCVFQWDKSRYRCFCCKEPFSELATLRDHSTKHTIEEIERKIILQQNRLVKVEVSIITCKVCSKTIKDLTSLREHLTKDHGIEFVQTEDLLVPFKINGQLQCQLCSEPFNKFRLLNIHMNKHYQKHICYICGASFSNSVFLNLHKARTHKPLHCKQCDLLLASKTEKKSHDMTVHGVKFERKLRFPCPYCSQRFFQENFRVLHLVEKHGLSQPEYKCAVCSKVFITRSLCNNHVKLVHMKEKNCECDVCHKLFYSKSDMARHRVTHTGEKFACAMCNNPFATKDSLKRHVRRMHGGMQ